MEKTQGGDVKRLSNIIVFVIAVLYFLMDAMFATVAIPLARWIAAHWSFERVKRWIRSLPPYPTLLLFIAPLIVLEPVKPVAAYLVGTGRAVLGLSALVIGEILKLVCVERLFSICRAKLLSIPAFAWAYRKYSAAKNYLTSLEAWQFALRCSRMVRNSAHRLALGMRRARGDSWLPIRAIAGRQTRELETVARDRS
jgi:hypothetical protein